MEMHEQIHPLHNFAILHVLFGFCSDEDIKSHRCVCTSWWRSSIGRWRSHQTIYVGPFPKGQNSSLVTIQKSAYSFLQFASSPTNQCDIAPFRKFILDGYPGRRFFSICGSAITVLCLDGVHFPFVSDFCRAVYELQSLKELKLTRCRVRYRVRPDLIKWIEPPMNFNMKSLLLDITFGNLPICHEDFLRPFPNLENLELVGYGNCKPVFKAIRSIKKKSSSYMHIKKLVLHDERLICESLFEFLRNPTVYLEALKIHFNSQHSAESVHSLRSIIEYHGISLKILSVKTIFDHLLVCPNECIPSNFLFVNLKELYLSFDIFKSFEFLKSMPNLQKLDCEYSVSKQVSPFLNTTWQNMTATILPKLTHLRMNWDTEMDVTTQELRCFFNCLPNIKNLAIPLDNAGFELVCLRYPMLVTLEVMNYMVNDIGLTGLDEHLVRKINQLVPSNHLDVALMHVRRPNITLLNDLRTFKMTVSEFSVIEARPILGYCAVLYGLGQLQNVDSVQIPQELFIKYPSFQHEYN